MISRLIRRRISLTVKAIRFTAPATGWICPHAAAQRAGTQPAAGAHGDWSAGSSRSKTGEQLCGVAAGLTVPKAFPADFVVTCGDSLQRRGITRPDRPGLRDLRVMRAAVGCGGRGEGMPCPRSDRPPQADGHGGMEALRVLNRCPSDAIYQARRTDTVVAGWKLTPDRRAGSRARGSGFSRR